MSDGQPAEAPAPEGAALPAPRTREQRRRDTLDRLANDVDAWVATGDPDSGTPYLVPLSFLWEGETMVLATAADAPTSRNLLATGRTRIGLGLTRDVVLIEGSAEAVADNRGADGELPAEVGDEFAAKTGFDPRTLRAKYLYFRVRPELIQAWREVNELTGRDLMRDGRWLDPT